MSGEQTNKPREIIWMIDYSSFYPSIIPPLSATEYDQAIPTEPDEPVPLGKKFRQRPITRRKK